MYHSGQLIIGVFLVGQDIMLEVRQTNDPHTTLLVCTGKFDPHTTTGIVSFIGSAQELGYTHILLDFSGVTALDSVALKHLFLWYHQNPPHHIELGIVNPSPRIRAVLQQNHLLNLFPIRASDWAIRQNGTNMKEGKEG